MPTMAPHISWVLLGPCFVRHSSRVAEAMNYQYASGGSSFLRFLRLACNHICGTGRLWFCSLDSSLFTTPVRLCTPILWAWCVLKALNGPLVHVARFRARLSRHWKTASYQTFIASLGLSMALSRGLRADLQQSTATKSNVLSCFTFLQIYLFLLEIRRAYVVAMDLAFCWFCVVPDIDALQRTEAGVGVCPQIAREWDDDRQRFGNGLFLMCGLTLKQPRAQIFLNGSVYSWELTGYTEYWRTTM